jgi:hypothetical protein
MTAEDTGGPASGLEECFQAHRRNPLVRREVVGEVLRRRVQRQVTVALVVAVEEAS